MTSTASLAKTWGEGIRKARIDLGLSIVELAARVGIDPAHLSRGERGLAGIGDDYRIAIARELGRPVSELFPYPDTVDQEAACPNAASAADEGSSPTPATGAVTRSPAPFAAAPESSVPEGSRVHE